jgi:hypothetical protein
VRSLRHIGLTNIYTSMCGLGVMTGSGLSKGTYLNILPFLLSRVSIILTWANFFAQKNSTNLDNWSTMNFTLTCIMVICNHAMFFTMLFFIMVWGGLIRFLELCLVLWYGKE